MDIVENFSHPESPAEPPPPPPSRAAYNAGSTSTVVLTFWKDFDLEDARQKLDGQGLKISEHQESSLKNRRKLAEATRDFKKAGENEKTELFGPLLKSYQEEVDNLTKRAKFSENAFLNVYQKLYEAPDPVPALASATEASNRVGELEQDNRRMKQELEEFRAESAHLRNQQATVRRLEERNRLLEQQMEEKVKDFVQLKQQALAEENQKSLEALKEREAALHEQLRMARESAQNMQRIHEFGQSQLFELKAQSEEERVARQSELNLMTDEVDRAQARLTSLEREKEALKAQLQAMPTSEAKTRSESEKSSNLEASLTAKEKIISELHMELHNLETTLSSERDMHGAELKKLRSLLDERDTKLKHVEEELSLRPTEKQVDDLKKQIKILQAVGYNLVEAEEDWDQAAAGSDDMGKLEKLLLSKNRKMEHELTLMKVQLDDRAKEVAQLQLRTKELDAVAAEQKQLISLLEDDIAKVKAIPLTSAYIGFIIIAICIFSSIFPGHVVIFWVLYTLQGSNTFDRRNGRSDEWEASEAGMPEFMQRSTSKGGGLAQDNDNSMLAVVCGQRDRFRQKLMELEEVRFVELLDLPRSMEMRLVKEKLRGITADYDRTRLDNVKLYEKMRYVQEYSKDGPQPRGARKRGDDLETGSISDVEMKYKKLYEEDINPFAAFSRREREQRYRELGLRDRIALTSGRFLLGNKFARTFVFFYSIALHLLVFASLYRISTLSHYSLRHKHEPFAKLSLMSMAGGNGTALAGEGRLPGT
eukprot:SM000014S00288  [mRNA]  locus=s14:408159:413617:- [translate_table: standard]